MHIGNKINILVHSDKKYSKKDLAKHLNKTRQAIYDIIKNPDINTRTLRKIADYFNVSLDYFIEENSSMDSNQFLTKGIKKYNSAKIYIEDRLEMLEKRIDKLEKRITEYN